MIILFNKKNKKSIQDEFILSSTLSESEKLKMELRQAKNALDAAYSTFEHVTEPELIDSAIYELESVKMRYNFLYKKVSEITI